MTLRSFGNVMPIHIDMLELVGYVDAGRDLQPATGLNARRRAMMSGLHSLRRTTGADFGYDVAMWREFLLESGADFGYTHPYAFASVDAAVQDAIADPDVIAALAMLDQTDG